MIASLNNVTSALSEFRAVTDTQLIDELLETLSEASSRGYSVVVKEVKILLEDLSKGHMQQGLRLDRLARLQYMVEVAEVRTPAFSS